MKEYTVEIEGVRLHLCAADTLFSPDGLDEGTRQMLRAVEWFPGAAVLDLGCGNGVVGIYAALRVGEAGGYFVFVADKRGDRPPTKQKPAPQLSKKLARKYAKAGK